MAAASGSRVTDILTRPRALIESSGGGAAAVDGIGGARDIACLVGGEERHDGGDFGCLSEPPRRNPVDGNDTGAAFGQKADGGGSDDTGRAGHDGNPAIEANSIGHIWVFLSLV